MTKLIIIKVKSTFDRTEKKYNLKNFNQFINLSFKRIVLVDSLCSS